MYFFSDFLAIKTAFGIAIVGRRGKGIFQRWPVWMQFGVGFVGNLLPKGLTLPKVIQTHVGGDSVNPCVEARLKAKPVERSVSLEEGLLENFARLLAISQHVERKTENVPVMPSDQLLKCLTVTALGLLDKELFVLRLVNSLCGPFQYSFHGYEPFRRP